MSAQPPRRRDVYRNLCTRAPRVHFRERAPRWLRPAEPRFGVRMGVSLLLLGVLAVGALTGTAQGAPAAESPYANLATFARALAHIEMSYVGSIDQDKLIHGAIRGMVRSLDPHSDYLTPEEYRVLSSDTRGRFGGVGVEIDVRDGWLTVTSVFPNGPAQRAGVRVGDRFVSIDGRRARDMPIEEAVRRMRGEPGTEVKVALRRDEDGPAVELTLKREIISVDAVEAEVLPDRNVYVRLRIFQETTTRELVDALDAAEAATRDKGGVRGLLLDLRDNPGGLLDQAVSVSDEFLSKGVIVSTRGRGGRELSVASAREGARPDYPIVVLVNGYTASAAEIVAGALRDHKRALVVGTRTFGKGSVQNIIELPDTSALKVTVARYYTPSGRSIQAEGIEPDVVVEQVAPGAGFAQAGVSEASLEGHLENEPEGGREEDGAYDRSEPRRRGVAASGVAFADDFQARMAYQTLRAIALDREHKRKKE